MAASVDRFRQGIVVADYTQIQTPRHSAKNASELASARDRDAKLLARTVSSKPIVSGVFVKNYNEHRFLRDFELLSAESDARILNAGSAGVRFGTNCLNVDVQPKDGVDLVADIHDLPDDLAGFDAVVCAAVLQYCRSPTQVAREFLRVLKPGGLLYVEVPWIQPYCPDTPDRYRFSQEALRSIFGEFEILHSGASIRPGSAFVYLARELARSVSSNRYVNFAAAKVTSGLLWPLRYLRTTRESQFAGGCFLVARKPDQLRQPHFVKAGGQVPKD